MVNGVGPRNRVLYRRAHWRHLTNTVERLCAAALNGSATGNGDAAYSQITLGRLVTRLMRVNGRCSCVGAGVHGVASQQHPRSSAAVHRPVIRRGRLARLSHYALSASHTVLSVVHIIHPTSSHLNWTGRGPLFRSVQRRWDGMKWDLNAAGLITIIKLRRV